MPGSARVPVLVFDCLDTARSLHFYRDVLGIPGEADTPPPDVSSLPEGDQPHAGAAWLQCENLRILLHPAEKVSNGGISIYFQFDNIDEVVDRVASAGFEVPMQPRDHPLRGRIATVLDPDGRRIDLIRPL